MKLQKPIAALLLTVVLAVGVSFAQIPTGYYTSLNGKKEAELKTAIYNLVRNFTEVSSYSNLPSYFRRTDVRPGTEYWWDMYSNMNVNIYIQFGTYMNREHSFPKSWWGGSTTIPAYVDLNHLYPGEADANMAKSNYPLGEVNTSQSVYFDNGVTTVGYPMAGQGGGAKMVFEPADEYKGDFARTYFYMVTCYQNLTWKTFYMLSQNTYPTLTTWAQNLLLKWHREDPVSDKEKMRNNEVYKIQNNRNPFIDYPELAEYIWGNKKGQVFDASTSSSPTGEANLITPVQDMALDFGQVALGKTTTAKLWFKGEYLTAPVNLRVYTGNNTYFTLPTSSIDATLINSDDGYWLTMTYNPQEIGVHSSRLLIQGGGVAGSRGISLQGECLAVPTLHAPTALAATEITDSTYIANWTPVADEVVDYYLINRTKYTNGSATSEQVLAEEPATLVEDFGDSDSETYTIQSVRLGFVSDPSNLITVNRPAGVFDIEGERPWAVDNIPGGLRIMASETIFNVTVFDTTGRSILNLPSAEPYTDINLPSGVYLITAGNSLRPVKVMVR